MSAGRRSQRPQPPRAVAHARHPATNFGGRESASGGRAVGGGRFGDPLPSEGPQTARGRLPASGLSFPAGVGVAAPRAEAHGWHPAGLGRELPAASWGTRADFAGRLRLRSAGAQVGRARAAGSLGAARGSAGLQGRGGAGTPGVSTRRWGSPNPHAPSLLLRGPPGRSPVPVGGHPPSRDAVCWGGGRSWGLHLSQGGASPSLYQALWGSGQVSGGPGGWVSSNLPAGRWWLPAQGALSPPWGRASFSCLDTSSLLGREGLVGSGVWASRLPEDPAPSHA